MFYPDRRLILAGAGLVSGAGAVLAQVPPKTAMRNDPPEATMQPNPPARFDFEDVVRRARQLSLAPFDTTQARLPEGLERLDFDAWRDIRMKPDKALPIGPFRLHVFHLGHLYKRPVTINTIRDGIATPLPYTTTLFDYGRTKLEKSLPVNTGFAGFRLSFPLNNPKTHDEVCSFIGASYFRILGRGQAYGLSARALAVGAGSHQEEFPFFREFWVEPVDRFSDRVAIYALLDSASATGAYRFELQTGRDTSMAVRATLFARKPGAKLGLAPLTSMYFVGDSSRGVSEDFRTQLHDSDGLGIETASGEWIWRPLRNPKSMKISHFMDSNPRGYGLMQRERKFSAYQDLDLNYQSRPSYWVEPQDNWPEGLVELVELNTIDETNDNIVASYVLKNPLEAGASLSFGYRLTALLDQPRLSPNGRAQHTFQASARALGSSENPPDGARRFLIDFSGGDLGYYCADPGQVEAVASLSQGQILRAFVLANPHIEGLRAIVDVFVPRNETGEIRLFLRANARTLTETWTFPWCNS